MSVKSYRQRKDIKILNPVEGGQRFTSRRNAIKYLKRGQAIYIDEQTIEFTGHRHRIAVASSVARKEPAKVNHRPHFEMVFTVVVDSGLNCIGLQWPLNEQGTPGKSVAMLAA
jgi:hypothetical protein